LTPATPRSARLAGKIAVITGIASGQGRAAAHAFARAGAAVVGCDLNLDAATAVVASIRADGGQADEVQHVDLTNEAAVRSWAEDVAVRHGHVNILYANAAATRFAPLEDISYADWQWNFRHEVDVVFLPVRHFWPLLTAAEKSAVVLVGSTAGVTGSVTNGRLAHTATKGSVVAMTKQLAAEGAPRGIRVNCISPGIIRTPATEADLLAPGHPMRSIESHIPLGRVGEADEVAACALFLASDEASYVTGTNLMVDGGWSAVLPG
jgi:meso-butanediol dehydrogenase/(S,S)-butanediol dehydrogenase/diacetyl reductase